MHGLEHTNEGWPGRGVTLVIHWLVALQELQRQVAGHKQIIFYSFRQFFFTVELFLFSFIHILQIDPAGYYWPGHYNEVHFYLVVHIITESAWETTMIICPGFLFTF